MFRKIGFVSAPMLGAVMVSPSTPGSTEKQGDAARKVRPSDLSIYAPVTVEKCTSCKAHETKSTGVRGNIEEGVGVVRESVFDVYNVASSHTHRLDDFYQTGKEHSRVLFDYLNEPSNTMPRAGAIALGAATGYVFGLRNGFIRRMLYTTFGTAGMASICYPQDAEIYAQKGLTEAKNMLKIGYNFAYGVKPGDEQPMFPKIPSNIDELTDCVKELFSSAKDKITSQVTKSK